jgi:hypothetical protein
MSRLVIDPYSINTFGKKILLIERDAGFTSPELNPNLITEGFELKANEPVLINCILQKWGVKNKNGRIYPKNILIPQVQEYQKLIDTNSAVSEADHPDSSVISLDNISHMITKMWWGTGEQENVLYGQLKIIVSPGFIKFGICSVIGDKIVLYLQNKIRLGISSRGVGSLKEFQGENLVQNDFELIGFDLVSSPSTPGAFLFPSIKGDMKSVPSGEMNFNETLIRTETKTLNEQDIRLINAVDNFLL